MTRPRSSTRAGRRRRSEPGDSRDNRVTVPTRSTQPSNRSTVEARAWDARGAADRTRAPTRPGTADTSQRSDSPRDCCTYVPT